MFSTKAGNWNYPTTVRFGVGRITEIPEAAGAVGMSHPLLVTDPDVAKLPFTTEILDLHAKAGVPVTLYTGVRKNPVGGNVSEGVAAYRDAGCDGVIALGGGSPLDVGKTIALMVGQRRPLWDFEDRADWWTRVDPAGVAPIVAVPTTSGTGSEVGRASVIINPEEKRKVLIFHPKMLPQVVIADPALTAGLPPFLTAATGMDALSHSLEAYCAPGLHPLADGIALEGMRLVHTSLEQAVADGADLDARARMMAASTMGATAFQKGLGAMHALAHPIGAVADTHHGLTNAVVMPYVLRFNRAAIEGRIERLARYLGIDGGFDGFVDWVLELRQRIGIAHTLADIGVSESLVDSLAPMVVEDPSAGTNPIGLDVRSAADLLRTCIRGA